MSMGKVIAVNAANNIPAPHFKPGRKRVLASDVGDIEIVQIGVMYECEGRPILVPWAAVTCLELEKTAKKTKGKSAGGDA